MNPWKLATIGIAGVLTTSLVTGLTTAWMLRSPAPAEAVSAQAPAAQGRYAVATAAPARATVARSAPGASVRPVAMSTPVDCATTGDRVWRIAKPGLIGTLLGAGAGAAGGAIANGGDAAGKGALIGGLAGAALGTAYGAYRTKNECGTVFGGSGSGFAPAPSAGGDRVFTYAPRASTPPAASGPSAAPSGDRITVYDAGRSLPR
jgi:hypothetical protein